MEEQTIGMLVGLAVTIIVAVVQKLKASDTDNHGDSFLSVMKRTSISANAVAEQFPEAKPYATEYAFVVEEADKVWNSGGFTSADIKLIEFKAKFYLDQIDAIVSKSKG